MTQWRVIFLFFVIQIIAMGCRASRQYNDQRNYRGDRNQRSGFHRGSYFYPKRENHRGMLNSRAAPRISNQENYKRQRILSYNPPQEVPGLEPAKITQQQSSFSPEVFFPRLPNHYINLHEKNLVEKRRRLQRLAPTTNKHRVLNYPIFEGDEPISGSSPPSAYGGLKAEIVFNTVMSDKKYKMMEPVPGQLLFPPKVLSFKTTPPMLRKPIFNGQGSNRINSQRMIPFYAHEAINPWSERVTEATPILMPWTSSSTTTKPYIAHIPFEENRIFATSSTTQFPQIVYAIPYSIYNSNKTTSSPFIGNQPTIDSQYSQAKSSKSYRAYWNREDVSIKPVHEEQYDFLSPTPAPKRSTESAANKQISAPKFLRNHKIESTTPLSTYRIDTFTTLNTTENPEPADLWSDQSEVHKKVLTSMQGGFKSCYPIQVYTLNKLLKKGRDKNTARTDQNKALSPNDLTTDGAFSEDSEIQTPKRARHVSNDLTTISVEPNFDWVEMDPSYQQIGYPTEKYSSQYKFSAFNPMSRKSMPKVNKSEAILGTHILVQS